MRRRGAELAFLGGEAGADAAQLLFEGLAAFLLQLGSFPLLGDNGSLEVFAALFEAADAHERANGRLFREVEFAQFLTAGERLPYTLAIHPGRGGRIRTATW